MMAKKIDLLLSKNTFVRIDVEAIGRENGKNLFQMDKMFRSSFAEHKHVI